MQAKLLEIRDSGTFIPVLAIDIDARDGYLASRAGFGSRCIELVYLASNRCAYDPYDWADRTLQTAHVYIEEHWDEIEHEDVIDVQHILGETATPKQSERFA